MTQLVLTWTEISVLPFFIFEAVNPWIQFWKICVFLHGKYQPLDIQIMGNNRQSKSTYLCVIMDITEGKEEPTKDRSFQQGEFAFITLKIAFYIA